MSSEKSAQEESGVGKLSRRDFFKVTGAGAVAAGLASSAIAGHANGKDPMTHLGWEKEARGERFNRRPFEKDNPPYRVLGPTRNIEYLSPTMFRRNALAEYFNVPAGTTLVQYLTSRVNRNNLAATPLTVIDHPVNGRELIDFYQTVRNRDGFDLWAEDLKWVMEINPRHSVINAETSFERIIKDAYVGAQRTYNPHNSSRVTRPPESDFAGCNPTRYQPRGPREMSRLIKKIGYMFGAPIVRITRLNPDWFHDRHLGGRGFTRGERFTIQPHWQFAIVMGTPMSWETVYGNPLWGDSHEGYGMIGAYVAKMTNFVKNLGWPARPNDPGSGYDLCAVPIAVDAGCGEQGRMGICVTPEFGANFRPGMVVTNLPLEPDKPIDFGLKKFCENCKICAEHCPTQAITYGGVTNIGGRGYEGWMVDPGKCHNAWHSVPGGIPAMGVPGSGCRICQAVCPFTQKANWLHKAARNIAMRDPTGLSHRALVWMENAFYGSNPPEHYHYVDGSREFGVVNEQPWWMKSEDFLVRP